ISTCFERHRAAFNQTLHLNGIVSSRNRSCAPATMTATYHQKYSSEERQKAVSELIKCFVLDEDAKHKIVNGLLEHIRIGLQRDILDLNSILMVPSYVVGRPTGEETGHAFLALDLGGTNLRVCHIELQGKGNLSIKQQKYTLTEYHKTSDGRVLFDFIA